MAKIFTISALDRDTAKFLIMERKQLFNEQLSEYSKVLNNLNDLTGEEYKKFWKRINC
ncbi:MAG: hypothetical protein ACLT90_17735 [Enterococcus raffinosus]